MKVVVFDIDDTITYETEFLKQHAPKFLKDKYDIDIVIKNENGYNLEEIYDLNNILVKTGLNEEEAKYKSKKITNDFWNSNFIKYNLKKVRPGVKDLIHQLKKDGYDIHFVSLRGKKTKENDTKLNEFVRLKIVPLITKILLFSNGIKYDKLTLVKNEEEKLDYIKFYNPDLLFEDQICILENADFTGKKICITNPHNENYNFNEDISKISDYNYDKNLISKYTDNTNHSKVNIKFNKLFLYKLFTETSQTLVKEIGKYYFINHYHPIVIGDDKIPDNDGIAFVGNHRHKLDPVFISIYAKKSIHWAALLRMFQGKEDLFSGTKGKLKCDLSAWFITMMGAKPIARKTDENFEQINLKTITELTELLDINSSIGFFPEGTINRSPDKINMVPLKSMRVFRMATDTDSYVQPVSIVWIPKELNIKNRVILIFSHPINTNNRNKKQVKDIWQETINLNINKSNEFINMISTIPEEERTDEKVKKLVNKFQNNF